MGWRLVIATVTDCMSWFAWVSPDLVLQFWHNYDSAPFTLQRCPCLDNLLIASAQYWPK